MNGRLLWYEAIEDKSAELCFICYNAHSELYFPKYILLEIVLRICYNKLVKVALMLVHYRKILHKSLSSET